MKALILAAGRGTRIHSLHGDHPKCLIRFGAGESTILDHQIQSLFSAGVRDIGIVVGYEKQQIIQHVERNYRSRFGRFTFIENPMYAKTNNIYSFWLAQEWINGDSFICLNADVVFDPRVLSPTLRSRTPVTMIVDPQWRDETMKVVISDGKVVRMSKKITEAEFSGTYIGITSFSAGINRELFARIGNLIRSGRENEFFNVAVQELADEGLHIGYTNASELPWAEIDDPGDLAFAKQHVFPSLIPAPIAA